MDAFAAENLLNLWDLLRSAEAVAARTLGAGPPPGAWSGSESTAQRVEVAVEEALCGGPPAGTVLQVEAAVVRGARTAGEEPALAGWITGLGARLVWLLAGDAVADQDLGVLQDDEELRAFLRRSCGGPPPPGTGAVLLVLAEAVEALPRAAAPFAALPPTVVDVDGEAGPLRLTVSGGRVRVFTGVRYARVARSRPPDARARLDAGTLARVLAGRESGAVLEAAGFPPVFARALAEAGSVIATASAWRERVEAAAGAGPAGGSGP